MKKFDQLASESLLNKTIKNLKANGIESFVYEDIEDAKSKIWELLPEGSEVMTMSSETLRLSGIADEINNSDKFDSVKNKLNKLNRETDEREMQKLGAAPEYAIGSVHAVTSD